MITTLSIGRFKSIRSLRLLCRKVNVFIGAPDTGKTNILEALHLICCLGWALPIGPSLRLRGELGFEPLFYHQFIDQPFEIILKNDALPRAGLPPEVAVSGSIHGDNRSLRLHLLPTNQSPSVAFANATHVHGLDWLGSYQYAGSEHWSYDSGGVRGTEVVSPHYGRNLIYIARHNKAVNDFLKDIVSSLNLRAMFDPIHRAFRLLEIREDEALAYNLDLLSDTLKRLFFYKAILLTSHDSTLVLDEPDVFAFPPYPKALGEMIADDETNQFFLTTHNPYFLISLISKTLTDRLAVFICDRDSDGATKAKELSSDDLSRVVGLGASVFFNLDEFLS